MALLLYALTALLLLAIAHRVIGSISLTAGALLLLLPFCLTGYALLTDQVYAPIDFAWATEPLLPMRAQYGVGKPHNSILSDVACQMIPWRKAVQWSISHHQWPLLNPFMLSGDILAAAAQPAAYSPFTLIALLLPVAKSFTYSAAIAFFIAGLGAFLFARELGCRQSVSLIAAVGWMYSTALSFFILWPLGFSWTFLPHVLLGVRRVVRTPTIRTTAFLTGVFVLLLLSGHPETDLHIVFLGALYALFELSSNRSKFWTRIAAGVTAGVLSLLLTAVYIGPILEAAPQSEEHQSRAFFANLPREATLPVAVARLAGDVLPFVDFRTWNIAGMGHSSIETCATGSIMLAFAIYAMIRIRSPLTWFFAAMALFCVLQHAEWGPAARLLQKLPLFDITLNSRFSFGAAFSGVILAAIGIEFMLATDDYRFAAAASAIVLVILAVAMTVIARSDLIGDSPQKFGHHKGFAELAGLAAVTMTLSLLARPQWSGALILGILLLQRTISETGVYKTLPPSIAYPPVPIFAKLEGIRVPFRVTGIALTFIPNMSAMYELEDVRGYEAMTFRRYTDTYPLWSDREPVWFNRVNDLTKPFLSFLNVRFAVVWENFPLPDGWRIFAKQRGTWLLENTRVVERAFVPRHATIGMADSDALSAMSRTTDFRERAWISEPVPVYERDNGPGHIDITPRGLGYDLAADMEQDGWVVTSQAAWAGWRAYLDGRRAPLHVANVAFLSVYVPRGRHHVRLVYRPHAFVAGRTISISTLAGVCLFAIWRLRRPRQRAR